MVDPKKDANLHQLNPQLGMFGVVLILVCGTISSYLFTHLPSALTRADLERHPGAFIAERAWENLKVLNDFGPKTTGSDANERLAADYIKREIELIQASKHKNQKVLVEHQVVTGGYSIWFMGHPLTSLYRNVQNLVVKLPGENDNSTEPALMLNCHFDSHPTSPGASDDTASCCVMLEIMRVISRQPKRNRHSIIFLFNGAEETPLQAAHGFITQHPWAGQIKAFLNLESAGSGGKEILFQSGPQHPWMIDVYARAIRHPFAQAASEEIFQFGLVPSDTDFRIFRDFGHVPGMDFAHMIEGHRYHTKYDNIDYLSMSVLQRTGDNILALTREMVNSDELANTESASQGYSVFYDFMGLLFVCYTTDVAVTINTLVAILAILLPYFGLSRSVRRLGEAAIIKEAIYGFLATVLGAVLSVVACLIIGRQLDAMDRAMSWYSTPSLILGLYCCPALLCHCFTQIIVNRMFADKKTSLNLSQTVQSRLIGVNLFWALLVVSMTFFGIRSAYIGMVLLLVSVMSAFVNAVMDFQNTTRKWLVVHLGFQLVAMLWATQFYHMSMRLFVPISGRIGEARNPEYFIGTLAAACVLLIGSYLFPLVGLLKKASQLTNRLTVFILIALLLACFTQVGFPYRDDSAKAPAPQRQYATHVLRVYHDELGLVRNSHSGYIFKGTDRNALRTIKDIAAPEMVVPMRQTSTCETEIFCTVPFYSILHQALYDNYWLPGPEPVVDNMVKMAYQSKEQLSDHVRRLTFTMEGSIQSSLIIAPKPGVKLVGWSLLDEVTPSTVFKQQQGHFVAITHGLPGAPWNVTMDFEHTDKNHDGLLADAAVTTTFWTHYEKHTDDFKMLINKYPPWTNIIPSVVVTNIYAF